MSIKTVTGDVASVELYVEYSFYAGCKGAREGGLQLEPDEGPDVEINAVYLTDPRDFGDVKRKLREAFATCDPLAFERAIIALDKLNAEISLCVDTEAIGQDILNNLVMI